MVSWVLRYEIPIIRRSSPALDLTTVASERLATDAELSAVHANRITPTEILSKARAGSSLIGAQPTVASFDVGVSVAFDLLKFCIPVRAFAYPTEVRYALEGGDCQKVAVIVVTTAVFIRGAAVVGVARVVLVAIAETTTAVVAVIGATILRGMATDVKLRI